MAVVTVVTLVDEDGDEFPVALPGVWSSRVSAYDQALREAATLVSEEKWRPNGALRLGTIEFPDDRHV